MLVACEYNQLVIRVFLEKGGGTFGHAFIPQQLGLEEVLEVVMPCFPGVAVVYPFYTLAIGVIGRCHVGGDFPAVLIVQAIQAGVCNTVCYLGRDIQGNERQSVLTGITQYRCIQPVIHAPALVVPGGAQHGVFVAVARHVFIQGLL